MADSDEAPEPLVFGEFEILPVPAIPEYELWSGPTNLPRLMEPGANLTLGGLYEAGFRCVGRLKDGKCTIGSTASTSWTDERSETRESCTDAGFSISVPDHKTTNFPAIFSEDI